MRIKSYLDAYFCSGCFKYQVYLDRAERYDLKSRLLLFILLFFFSYFRREEKMGKGITKVGILSHAFVLERIFEIWTVWRMTLLFHKRLIFISRLFFVTNLLISHISTIGNSKSK